MKRETPSPLDLMASKELIEEQIEKMLQVIQNPQIFTNSLTKMFRSLKYELDNTSREKKIERLIHLLNRKN